MLSHSSKYAIRALIYIAVSSKNAEKVGIKQISNELHIPAPFLGKILQNLAKHKLLHSTKGPHGGFSLAKSADDINLAQIIEIIDGLDAFRNCMLGMGECKGHIANGDVCPVHPKAEPLRREMYNMFRTYTVGVLAKDLNSIENLIML